MEATTTSSVGVTGVDVCGVSNGPWGLTDELLDDSFFTFVI